MKLFKKQSPWTPPYPVHVLLPLCMNLLLEMKLRPCLWLNLKSPWLN